MAVPVAKTLARTQFGSLAFPGKVIERELVGRHHVHEYPHTPGGSPEKLGRGLWRTVVESLFDARAFAYTNLYPDGLNQIRSWAELQVTQQFTHPSAGSFPAFIINFRQRKVGSLLSGEAATITFLEDQEASNLASLAPTYSAKTLGTQSAALVQALVDAENGLALTPQDISVFDALQSAVNTVLGFEDTTQLWGNRYQAAISQVLSLAAQLDESASLQDARAWPVVEQLRALQFQATQLQLDTQSQRQTLQKYYVPSTMSITQVARNLYNDASRQSDLLALNVVNDPLSILAGTVILYYPATAQEQAAAASSP